MTNPVVPVPTVFQTIEEKLAAIELTAKTLMAELPTNVLSTIEADIESGVSKVFPSITPILNDIAPFLPGVMSTIEQLVQQILALKAVPVSPPAA